MLQFGHDAADAVVQVLQHCHQDQALVADIGKATSIRLDVVLRCLRWRMDRVVGKIKKERPRFVSINEGDGFLRQTVGQIAFVVDPLLVAIDRMHELAFRVRTEIEVVMRAAAHEFVALVESPIERVPLQFGIVLIQAQVPFADRRRDIRVRQKRREDRGFRIEPTSTIACRVHTDTLLVTSQHQTGARRRADMSARVSLRERDTIVRQCIHMRCRDLFRMMRIQTDVSVALIVRQNHDDVGLRGGCGLKKIRRKPTRNEHDPDNGR